VKDIIFMGFSQILIILGVTSIWGFEGYKSIETIALITIITGSIIGQYLLWKSRSKE